MRAIPQKHRKQIDADKFFKECIRKHEGTCKGRITIEHCWIYAGKQISEMWAYIPLCWHHHLVDLDKGYGQYISLIRATHDDLLKYPRVNWEQLFKSLNEKYV